MKDTYHLDTAIGIGSALHLARSHIGHNGGLVGKVVPWAAPQRYNTNQQQQNKKTVGWINAHLFR